MQQMSTMSTISQLQNQAGLSAFFNITTGWGLTADQQRLLLGSPAKDAFLQWKQHRHGILRAEHKNRILTVLRIYRALNALYSSKNVKRWLTVSNPNRLFNNRSPLDHMLTGRESALQDVIAYLDWVRE